jgi:hypothetical protein
MTIVSIFIGDQIEILNIDQQANGYAARGDDGDGDGDGDHDDPPYIVFGYGSLIFRVRSNSIYPTHWDM